MSAFDRLLDRALHQHHLPPTPVPWQRRPPSSVAGLPWGLIVADFTDADAALAKDRRKGRTEPLRSRMPASYLDGTDRPDNASRMAELRDHPPRRFAHGLPVYPVLLAPDPTSDDKVNPLAVIANTGYIGSLRNRGATDHRRLIEYTLEYGYFCVIEAAVDFAAGRFAVRTLDNVPTDYSASGGSWYR